MKRLGGVLLLFSFVTCLAKAKGLDDLVRSQATGQTKVTSFLQLVPAHLQMTCAGMDAHLRESIRSVKDLTSYIKNQSGQASLLEILDFHNYLKNRAPLDLGFLSYQEMFQIDFKVSTDSTEQIDAVGVLSSTGFWFFPVGNYQNIKLKSFEQEGALKIQMELNSFDICTEKEVQVLSFFGCDRNDSPFINCSADSPCSEFSVGFWDSCEGYTKTQVDLEQLKGLLGKRSLRLQRRRGQ
jgi:hypothetical protein